MPQPVLEVCDVSKRYRHASRLATDSVSFTLAGGEILGLLGPNGAGKTTLVRQIMGMLRSDGGRITICGKDLAADRAFARQVCAYQPQETASVHGLTPTEAVVLVGRLRGGRAADVRTRAASLFQSLDMSEWAAKPADQLSGGIRRLLGFAMSAVVPARVVILDEPSNDVDPHRRRLLWAEVRRLAGSGAGIILVSHNVLEVERAVDRVAVLDHGRLIALDTPANLKRAVAPGHRLDVVPEPGKRLGAPPDGVSLVSIGHCHTFEVPAQSLGQAAEWARRLSDDGLAERVRISPTGLEDVYDSIISKGPAE